MSEGEIKEPGQSKHLVSPSKAKEVNPDFFEGRKQNWVLKVKRQDGTIEELEGIDWEAVSPFGSVRSAVVVNDEGLPQYDRPRYEEAPNVNIVAWGRDPIKREIRVALISQPRPHADHPFDPENKEDLTFAQIPMGFKERLLGRDQIEGYESSKDAATREVQEETGATVIRDIFEPEFPAHNPNPTFVGTWSDLVFVEVDLEKVEEMKAQRDELIFKAEYIPLKQLWREIRAGKSDRGITRMCTSNSALLIYLSYLGELNKRSKMRDTGDLSDSDKEV